MYLWLTVTIFKVLFCRIVLASSANYVGIYPRIYGQNPVFGYKQ